MAIWKACTSAAGHAGQTVIAILQIENQRHTLASRLEKYSCVEKMEFDDLLSWADRIERTTGYARAVELIDFVCSFTTNLKTPLAKVRSGLASEKAPSIPVLASQIAALLEVARTNDLGPVRPALDALARVRIEDLARVKEAKRVKKVRCHRKELPFEMKRALAEFTRGGHATLRDAAMEVRNRTRLVGRPVHPCSLGSTYLVKGLEFDRAVIVSADELDREDLYVALTRGSRSLTILSRSPVLPVGATLPAVPVESQSERAHPLPPSIGPGFNAEAAL